MADIGKQENGNFKFTFWGKFELKIGKIHLILSLGKGRYSSQIRPGKIPVSECKINSD